MKHVCFLVNIVFFILINSCALKPVTTQRPFRREDINAEYIKSIDPRIKEKVFKKYECILKYEIVNQSGIGEFTYLNLKNKQGIKNINLNDKYYILSFLKSPRRFGSAVLIVSLFNAKGDCLKLGPAFIGNWNGDEIAIDTTVSYNVKKEKWENYKSIPLNINYYSSFSTSKDTFAIESIVYNKFNKLGGKKKPIIFNIKEIYGDENFLHFDTTGLKIVEKENK